MHKDWTSNLAIINFIQMVDVLCAWSHDTDRPGICYQCHKVKKMTALLHQCASWISVESVPVIHLQFRSQSTCIFAVKSSKASRLCTAPYQHMINFTCVLQCTSQDKTSWTWRSKFQESYEMEGTCFHQIRSVSLDSWNLKSSSCWGRNPFLGLHRF